jgi:hypothetical protein
LYAWNLNGSGSFNGTAWNGGVNLIQVGVITPDTNHLGGSTYIGFDGTNDVAYAPGTTFDDTGSFTIGGWFKVDPTNSGALFGKYESTNVNRSFLFFPTQVDVYYDASGNRVQISATGITSGVWQHVALVYNQSDTSMMIVVNGKVTAYNKNASLSARNNSSGSKLTFGGLGNGTATNPFKGLITDTFYSKTALSLAQIRRLYVTGTKLSAYTDQDGKTKINGENLGFYWPDYNTTSLVTSGIAGASMTNVRLTPYRTTSGNPKIKFAIELASSGSNGGYVSINGIVYSYNQTGYMFSNIGYHGGVEMQAGGNGAYCYNSTSGGNTRFEVGGDAFINALPSWSLDLSTLY